MVQERVGFSILPLRRSILLQLVPEENYQDPQAEQLNYTRFWEMDNQSHTDLQVQKSHGLTSHGKLLPGIHRVCVKEEGPRSHGAGVCKRS